VSLFFKILTDSLHLGNNYLEVHFLLLIHMVCTMVNIVIMSFNNRGTKWNLPKRLAENGNEIRLTSSSWNLVTIQMFKVVLRLPKWQILTQMFSHRVKSFSVAISHRKLYNRECDGNAWRWVEIPTMLFIKSYHNFVKSGGLCNVSLSFEVNDYTIKVWAVNSNITSHWLWFSKCW